MVYKNVDYIEKGKNPFYYFSDIDPEWYFDNVIYIHPKCKVINNDVCDDFVDIDKIIFPKGLKKIGDRSFRGCSRLKEINLKEGLTHIGKYAFSYCNQVRKIVLPASIKKLDEGCFMYIDYLESIIYKGTVEEFYKIKKGKNWLHGDYELDIKCSDGKIPIKSRVRYARFDSKEELVNKDLVKDEIKEIISLPIKDRIERARGIYASLINYLNSTSLTVTNDINYLILGIAKIFITNANKYQKSYYQKFIDITNLDISYKAFNITMHKKDDMNDDIYDIVTCNLPITKRLNVCIIGAAIVATNKRLSWKIRRLIKVIMGIDIWIKN